LVAPKDFLAHVLPPTGWYVAHIKLPSGAILQYACASVDELWEVGVWADAQTSDVYFAVASYKDKQGVWSATKGRNGGYELRCHANVAGLASLITDIDTKESKPNAFYATREEAYKAVVVFCANAGIPFPTVVGSGGGLHLYWTLEVVLQLLDWRKLALALKAAAAFFGLHCDPPRTADGSSVLRPVGTTHWKTGRTVECASLEPARKIEDFKALERFENGSSDRVNTRHDARPSKGSPLLGQMYGPSPSDAGSVFSACAQLRQLATDPGRCGEPLHYAAASVAHASGPGGLEHYLGLLGAEWRPTGSAKAVQWAKRTGDQPATCQHFEGLNRAGCHGCPYKARITTPTELGRYPWVEQAKAPKPAEAPPLPEVAQGEQLPGVPEPFIWSDDKPPKLLYKLEGKGGIPITTVVSDTPIYLLGVSTTETTDGHIYNFRQLIPNRGWRTISVAAERYRKVPRPSRFVRSCSRGC